MASDLQGKRVAILATGGFEQSELVEPRRALTEAGAASDVISPAAGKIRGWNHGDWGEETEVDVPLDDAQAADYDALLLPGGVMSPDRLRMNKRAVEFVREFVEGGKPVAAICHGPWMLVEAGVVEGHTLTSWPSLATDIRNAGGKRVDEEVFVCTGGPNTLVTSRKPGDIPAFNAKMLAAFAQA